MKNIKSIAMYLPQFHQIPENDEWWGEGFTEWVATRKAEKIFDLHNQPREPWGDNYYCLLEKETLLWQAELMKKYNIGGLCFYHYYFKDGKQILEKPAELLLENKDIEMPFCFCWANQTWARTWSKLRSKNFWSSKYEECPNEGDGVLLEQKYGREVEWEKHFNYLLPFLLDKRYIRVDNKPVILIYLPNDIVGFAEMIDYWKGLAKKNGIPGLYVIGENTNKMKMGLDAAMYSGPIAYWAPNVKEYKHETIYKNGVKCYKYEELWENALVSKPVEGAKTYYGAFVDYDDTPRKGKNGTVLVGTTVEKFEKYLYEIAKKNKDAGNEFLFINAWNEWGEGMYLEPDKKVGYKYLEVMKRVIEKVNNISEVESSKDEQLLLANEKSREEILEMNLRKYIEYFNIMGEWLSLKEKKINMGSFLKRYGFNKVAIYGIGVMGEHLINELNEEGVQIEYIVDRQEEKCVKGIKKLDFSDEWPQVDAIIITPVFYYDDIRSEIKKKVNYPVISMLEMIKEV